MQKSTALRILLDLCAGRDKIKEMRSALAFLGSTPLATAFLRCVRANESALGVCCRGPSFSWIQQNSCQTDRSDSWAQAATHCSSHCSVELVSDYAVVSSGVWSDMNSAQCLRIMSRKYSLVNRSVLRDLVNVKRLASSQSFQTISDHKDGSNCEQDPNISLLSK